MYGDTLSHKILGPEGLNKTVLNLKYCHLGNTLLQYA